MDQVPQKVKKMLRMWVSRYRGKKVKNGKYRFRILEEWVDTEKAYISHLQLIIKYLSKPLKDKFINDQQHDSIFANIQALLNLNSAFLKQLQQHFNTWDPQNTIISSTLLKFSKFFKFYAQYCTGYHKGDLLLQKLRKQRQEMNLYILGLQGSEKFNGLSIQSMLIKPVQRVPKYLLLLQTYFKHLNLKHKDYKNIKDCIEQYHNVNTTNNLSMEEQLKNQEMIRLHNRFGNNKNPILHHNRRYISAHQGKLLNDKEVGVYLFTDMIMLTEKQKIQSRYKDLKLDQNSYIQNMQSHKYFKNIIFISTSTLSFILLMKNNQLKQELLDHLNSQIAHFKEIVQKKKEQRTVSQAIQSKSYSMQVTSMIEDMIQKMRVFIIASQKRGNVVCQNNIYVIEYEIGIIKTQMTYTENSLFNKIDLIIQNCSLNIELITSNNKVGFFSETKNKSQIMELRKLYLQQFLNNLFKQSSVFFKWQWIMSVLGIEDYCYSFLDENFYEAQTRSYIEEYNKKKSLYEQKICNKKMNGVDIIDWIVLQSGRIEHSKFEKMKQKMDKFIVKIHLLDPLQQKIVKLSISKYTRIEELHKQLCTYLEISSRKDFAIFLQERGAIRKLDDDQQLIMLNIQEEEERKGFFSRVKQKCKTIVQWGQQIFYEKRLIFKKWIYLMPNQIYQRNLYKQQESLQNINKMKLVISEIFYRISKGEFSFKNVEWNQQMLGLYLFINSTKLNYTSKSNFPIDKIKQIIPKNIFEKQTKSLWVQKIIHIQQKLYHSTNSYQNTLQRILELAGDYSWISFQGWLKNNLIQLQIHYNCAKIKGTVSATLYYKNLQVRNTPFSLFLMQKNRQFRIDFHSPLSIKETIQVYQQIYLKIYS